MPNVVVVSVTYRLGSFGFLSHPKFSNPKLGDHNVGFLDQSQALRWIQAHIDAFGGDPRRVTINGQSAGGSSVELHLVSPPDEGLFNQAIAQSVYRQSVTSPQQQEVSRTLQYSCPSFRTQEQHSLNSIFSLNKSGVCRVRLLKLCRAFVRQALVTSHVPRTQHCASTSADFQSCCVTQRRFYSNGSFVGFHPVVDGKSIVSNPTTSILQGSFFKVPLIVGYDCSRNFL